MPIIRDDLSDRLVHLTKGEQAQEAFLAIVQQRRLLGGHTDVRGGHRCVCFSEAPISKLAHLLAAATTQGVRYQPFGVMVDKAWLFAQGGRPVIYQPESEYPLLHETQQWRHVRYQPPATDYTWEREWRVRIDELPLDPAAVTLVVPTRAWARWFLRKHEAANHSRLFLLAGLGGSPFPWHFVALADIGVPFADVGLPPDEIAPLPTAPGVIKPRTDV